MSDPHIPPPSTIPMPSSPSWGGAAARLTDSDVSVNALLALQTVDAIQLDHFNTDRKLSLDSLALYLRRHLEAESCAIFVVSADSLTQLELAATSTDATEQPANVSLAIRSGNRSGLTGHIAFSKKSVRLHGSDLALHSARAGREPLHLQSRHNHSLLAVPVLNRTSQLIALIKLENKKPDGEVKGFSSLDQKIVEDLAQVSIPLFEHRRRTAALRDIAELAARKGFSETLSIILERGIRFLGGDRGDIFIHDPSNNSLVLRYVHGGGKLSPGEAIPEHSLTASVYRDGRPTRVPDVTREARYFRADPKTRSELLVPMEWRKHRVGVLNVESFRHGWLDTPDQLEDLKFFAQYAAVLTIASNRDEYIRGMLDALGQTKPRREFLTMILKNLRDLRNFDGAIYLADYDRRVLSCEASIGRETPGQHDLPVYQFDESAFATEVFRKRASQYEPSPWENLDRVNRKGLEAFKIRGPLVGVPLIIGANIVGVLSVWGDDDGSSPGPHDIATLELFARGAALAVGIAEADAQRRRVMTSIEQILLALQNSPTSDFNPSSTFKAVLEGVRALGFQCARLYEYQVDQLSLRSTVGTSDDAQAWLILIERNSRAREIVEHALRDPAPWQYDVGLRNEGDDAFGQSSQDVRRTVIPLYLRNKLEGLIIADGGGAVPMGEQPGSYLHLFADLAALATTTVKRWGLLRALGDIQRFGTTGTYANQVRRMLVFLTSGDGLGFNRAIYLNFEQSAGRFVYYDGIGSVSRDQFKESARSAELQGLHALLQRAEELDDGDLHTAMNDFAIARLDPAVSNLVQQRLPTMFHVDDNLAWMSKLNTAIGAKHVLVAPVYAGGNRLLTPGVRTAGGGEDLLCGIVVVDRHWEAEARALDEDDRKALAGAVILGSRFLSSSAPPRETIAEASSEEGLHLNVWFRDLDDCVLTLGGSATLQVAVGRSEGWHVEWEAASAMLVLTCANADIEPFTARIDWAELDKTGVQRLEFVVTPRQAGRAVLNVLAMIRGEAVHRTMLELEVRKQSTSVEMEV